MQPNLSEIFRDDKEISLHSPKVVWSIFHEGSSLLDAIFEYEPILKPICERFPETLPSQRVWGFGETGVYIRPDRHARALYLRLDQIADAHSDGGCIAIKGGEVICQNFDDMIQRLKGMWNIWSVKFGDTARTCFDDWGMMSALDRFPLGEGKPPGVVTLHDVTEEAERAYQIQKAYWKQYGSFARLPLPLFGYSWPEDVVNRIWQQLNPHLSPAAHPLVEAQLKAGLGAYVYYYPKLPLRVEHLQLADVGGAVTYEKRFDQLSELAEPREIVERWITLTARMLCLGFVPARPTNVGRGYSVMAQNSVVDGGFVDMGGMQTIETFQNESDLAFAISRSIQVLGHTICRFLVGSFADSDVFTRRVPGAFALVWDGVRQNIEKEIAAGMLVPTAVRRFMTKNSPADDLLYLFSHLFAFDSYRSEDPEQLSMRLHS